ncbi:MAG: YbaN family protein [Sedimenticola sp.]
MRRQVKKSLLLLAGWVSLATGVVGIFLPLLPTTPFLLLSAWCFSRSSVRLHSWLLNNRYFGGVVKRWEEGRSMERRVKIRALFLVAVTFGVTLLWVPLEPVIRIGLALLAVALVVMLYRVPESEKEKRPGV